MGAQLKDARSVSSGGAPLFGARAPQYIFGGGANIFYFLVISDIHFMDIWIYISLDIYYMDVSFTFAPRLPLSAPLLGDPLGYPFWFWSFYPLGEFIPPSTR